MSRTAVYSALVLRNRPSMLGKEANSEVTLLTAEEGIIKATVFGGPKSKLRAHSAPYNSGQVWIYHDSSKDYRKLSDFDVHSWRPGLRELYDRTMAAGGLAETILSTHGGGGEWRTALELAVATLDALENANEELCPCLLVHFLWRWAGFLGIQPQIECCCSCGNEAANGPLWFSNRENSVFCVDCVSGSVPETELCPSNQALSPKPSSVPKIELCPSNQALSLKPSSVPETEICPQNQALSLKPSSVPETELCPQNQALPLKPSSVPQNGLLQLNLGCRRWLAAVSSIEPSDLSRYSMDKKSFNEAKALAAAVMTEALGKRLASWDW